MEGSVLAVLYVALCLIYMISHHGGPPSQNGNEPRTGSPEPLQTRQPKSGRAQLIDQQSQDNGRVHLRDVPASRPTEPDRHNVDHGCSIDGDAESVQLPTTTPGTDHLSVR